MIPSSRVAEAVRRSLEGGSPIIDAERVEWASRALDYYDSILRQEEHLTDAYLDLYSAKPDKWRKRPKTCYNLTRAVVSTLSTLWQDPVRRTWEKGQEQAAKAWGDVKGFDKILQRVDAFELLTGKVGVRPIVMPDQRIKFAVYTSDQVDYVPDPLDETEAAAVIVSWRQGTGIDKTLVQHAWTASSFERRVDHVPAPLDDQPNGPHKYGRIPIVWFDSDITRRGFFGQPAADLVKANMILNKLLTDLNWTVTWQTHGQAVIKGAPKDYVPEIGVGCYVQVDKDGDFSFASPGADILSAIEAINTNLRFFFAARRIPESAIMARQAGESGVALVAQASSLADWRKARINAFRDAEAELIQLTLEVQRIHRDGVKITVPVPQLTYREFKQPTSADELVTWETEIRAGVATWADYLMSKDPTLTREMAEERIKANREANREATMRAFPNFKGEGEDEDGDAE